MHPTNKSVPETGDNTVSMTSEPLSFTAAGLTISSDLEEFCDAAHDEWNLEELRLNQDFGSLIATQPIIANVAVRKPGPQEWFKVHPEWRFNTAVLHIKEDGETYLIDVGLRGELMDEIQPVMLLAAINRQQEVFIWPIRLPKVEGNTDKFIETDVTAARAAEEKWTRRYWVAATKSHKIMFAPNLTEEPVWPDSGFEDLLRKAFKEKFIGDRNHPVLKKLRGDQ